MNQNIIMCVHVHYSSIFNVLAHVGTSFLQQFHVLFGVFLLQRLSSRHWRTSTVHFQSSDRRNSSLVALKAFSDLSQEGFSEHDRLQLAAHFVQQALDRLATETEEKASHLFEESFGAPPVCPHCSETVRDAICKRIMVAGHDGGEGE